jgi:hypothetical protein
MGLWVSHECWTGAYSAFSRWREQLARTAGYTVAKVTWEDRDTFLNGSDCVLIDWGHITMANVMGDWDETPVDPLLVLIAHSDCEGVIHPAQAGPLADRLTELLPLLPDEADLGHIGDWRTKTQAFIDGLRAAVEAGEDVEFS